MRTSTQAARAAAQRQLHAERITWLTGQAPRWSCGTPVSHADREQLLTQSRRHLENPYG